jgi:hypothetical protein
MTTCVLRYRAPADIDIDVVVASLPFETTAVFRRVRISRSRERSDRRDVNSWIGHVNAQIAGM